VWILSYLLGRKGGRDVRRRGGGGEKEGPDILTYFISLGKKGARAVVGDSQRKGGAMVWSSL